jgi:hypothetical protein
MILQMQLLYHSINLKITQVVKESHWVEIINKLLHKKIDSFLLQKRANQ